MTDFRALCQELIDEIDAKAYGIKSLPSSVAIDRARAALEAQPEPQGPTDEEIDQIYWDESWRAAAEDQSAVNEVGLEEFRLIARAVIAADRARWGRTAIEPVPKQEDIHYAWELHDAEGEWQAGGSANSLEDVQREGNRYLQIYSQHGPHKLIIERHCVTTIEPVPGVEGADA
jgi:hypothetical protein